MIAQQQQQQQLAHQEQMQQFARRQQLQELAHQQRLENLMHQQQLQKEAHKQQLQQLALQHQERINLTVRGVVDMDDSDFNPGYAANQQRTQYPRVTPKEQRQQQQIEGKRVAHKLAKEMYDNTQPPPNNNQQHLGKQIPRQQPKQPSIKVILPRQVNLAVDGVLDIDTEQQQSIPAGDENGHIDEEPEDVPDPQHDQQPTRSQHMTPKELHMLQQLQQKYMACKRTTEIYNEPPPKPEPKPQPPTPAQVVARITAKLKWPDDKHHSSHEGKAMEMMGQWKELIKGQVVEGTSHMKMAIMRITEKIEPQQLRDMIREAANTGQLKNCNEAKRMRWLGRALWFSEYAVELAADAAETYDRMLQAKDQHRQHTTGHMNATHEMRYKEQHGEQFHARATVFEPDQERSLSDDDVFDMDYESDDEAFPAQVLLDAIEHMVTDKREKTIAWLQRMPSRNATRRS